MLRIAVCDDIPFCAERLAGSIAAWSGERRAMIQIMKFQSGEEILFEIENSGDFTAVFLDVELNGIAALKQQKEYGSKTALPALCLCLSMTAILNKCFATCIRCSFWKSP